MTEQCVDGLPVRLRATHDLGFLGRWGRVVRVFDDQDSGNLCFGMSGPDGPLFVKYAGAPTRRFEGRPADAVAALRAARYIYEELTHPALIALREAVEVGEGCALVFDWFDGVSLGAQFEERGRLGDPSPGFRSSVVRQLYDFGASVAAQGFVAIDLYDASLLVDPMTGRLAVCDIDYFRRAPAVNDMGRMWGSARFMAPEEHVLGAVLDEVTNVFTLGALAHTLLGNDRSKGRAEWRGTVRQWEVAKRAMEPQRHARWQSVAELAEAWRRAG